MNTFAERQQGNPVTRIDTELFMKIISEMNTKGHVVIDNLLGKERGLQILNEVNRLHRNGLFKAGQLLYNPLKQTDRDMSGIRGDKIVWVEGHEPSCVNIGHLINQIDVIIFNVNTMKDNGELGNYNIKERTKAMVACYPGTGSRYITHIDNPNKDGRVITAIYYLNINWDVRLSGGVLRLFADGSQVAADIVPNFDRLLLFWSDRRNPHEVQPSYRNRYAITLWYFDANERKSALDRCRTSSKETGDKNDVLNEENI